jgi:tRNA (adenine57-N1/adenine58-N1)-methyltransferase
MGSHENQNLSFNFGVQFIKLYHCVESVSLESTPMNNPEISRNIAKAGDIALIISAQNKRFLINLTTDTKLETHRGILYHNDLIGKSWGTKLLSHLGSPFLLLQPSLADILLDIRRNTQIMYPKEIGFILVTMGIGPGTHVLEAGTGSGSLTTALAFATGPQGRVISYEIRQEMQRLAQKNLERVGLADRVTFKLRDIGEGFDETGMDAVFLDVQNPQDYIPQARAALKQGGYFGSLLPTTNQVSLLLVSLKREGFGFIDVCEILLRYYKPVPDRLRPTDRMVAHTGFLIFARSVTDEITDLDSTLTSKEPSEAVSPEIT